MDQTPSIDLLQSGRTHYHAGRLAAAEADFRRAVELDGNSTDAWLSLGMVLHDQGRLTEAAEVLGKLIVIHPKCAQGWVQLARAIAPAGFAWEAHQAIGKALKARPDAETLVAASMVLMTLEDTGTAESVVRQAIKLSPQNASAWLQLGQVLSLQNQRTEAAAAYRKALACDPANTVAAFFLEAIGTDAGEKAPVAPKMATAPPEYVRALFDEFAHKFEDSLVGSLKYDVPKKLEQLFEKHLHCDGISTARTLTMLDAGCGTGLCGQWMARYRGRLIGVDLSSGMITKARERAIYDELIAGEVVEELERRPATFDLIVAADVLVYLGDLTPLFNAAATALRPGGIFMFSVESTADADFLLRPTQRFAHSKAYLQRLTETNGLTLLAIEDSVIRLEKDAEVAGYLGMAEKPT